MVTSGSSIFSVKSWQPSFSRAELYARNVESIRSASFSFPLIFLGRIRCPARNLSRFGHFFFFIQSGISDMSSRYLRCEGVLAMIVFRGELRLYQFYGNSSIARLLDARRVGNPRSYLARLAAQSHRLAR